MILCHLHKKSDRLQGDTIPKAYAVLPIYNNPLTCLRAIIGRVESG